LQEMERRHGKLSSVNRMKGLGGCKVPLLRQVATDPATRVLLRVAAPSVSEAKGLEELMGRDSTARKELIETY
jgi:DNA gyrase/topoisomerase IV subunit B